MTYEEAQSKIDDSRLQDELSRNLRRMNEAAKILRQRRTDRGALSLASPEVKFKIDTETHDPLDVGMYQVYTSLRYCLIAFMSTAGTSNCKLILLKEA